MNGEQSLAFCNKISVKDEETGVWVVNALQPMNAAGRMTVTVSGMVTELRFV